MRNSDNECYGQCYTHGNWTAKVDMIHESEGPMLVPDTCPICAAVENETALQAAFQLGWSAAEDEKPEDGDEES